MIKLYDNGVYLLNGTEILEDTGNEMCIRDRNKETTEQMYAELKAK